MRSSLSNNGWIWAFSLGKYRRDWINEGKDWTYSAIRNAKSKFFCLLLRFNALKSNSSGK
jgi:hypothetical protein